MGVMQASQTIQAWPEESKEAAQLVIKQCGDPRRDDGDAAHMAQAGPMETDRRFKDILSTQFPAYRFG